MKCLDVYKNLNLQLGSKNNMEISPCCLCPSKTTDKIDFFKNDYLNSIRQAWDQDFIPRNCQNCNRQTGSNQWYADNGYADTSVELLRIDFWTGDTCNLACVICGPHYSSTWKKELNFPIESRGITNSLWKELDTSKLKMIHFNGGEPLLNKEHMRFLENIPNKSQVHLNYNTNGTILPSRKLLTLWEQFKLVQLDFSIDDIGERFEYQRFPAKWSEVTKNLQWFIDNSPVNCMFAVNTTVSILNQPNLSNLSQWLTANFYTSRVNDIIEHRQQLARGWLATENFNKKLVLDFLNACDQRRGTCWRRTFPELESKLL